MKTYSNYIASKKGVTGQPSISDAALVDESENESSEVNEAAGLTSLASYDADKVSSLPEFPKSEKDAVKFAPAGYKTFEKKLNAIGCTVKSAFIEMYAHQGRIGGSAELDIVAPRNSKTNFWLRVNEKTCLFGFKEDFMKLSMYAQIQPDLIGKDLDDAIKEIERVRDFIQWYNSQDPAKIFPVLRSRA